MQVRQVAETLTRALGLDTTPIGVARADAPPAGVPVFPDAVPSACTLWRRAEQGVFYASAARHFNCPVGAMVMGFDLTADLKQQLMGLVGMMVSEGYLGQEEAAHIPALPTARVGAVYGPLAAFPIEPDFVLMWLGPSQAMIAAEAAGSCDWTRAQPPGVLGRPACAALPVSGARGGLALSLGCTGMRTFTEVARDRMLAVVSAANIEAFERALDAAVAANRSMAAFYERRKREVA
ncbi:MAG TPA: DUF169 domain-containing protein [Gemmatimonadales bacterium]|nr:DUF169 domain-containing protein [Gemmatimonadales bacterium]